MERAAAAYGRVLEALALLGCAVIFLMTVMICAAGLLPDDRLVRRQRGARQLQVWGDVHQNAGDAGMVAARAAAGSLPSARHRNGLPHAAAQARSANSARRRGIDGLNTCPGPPQR